MNSALNASQLPAIPFDWSRASSAAIAAESAADDIAVVPDDRPPAQATTRTPVITATQRFLRDLPSVKRVDEKSSQEPISETFR